MAFIEADDVAAVINEGGTFYTVMSEGFDGDWYIRGRRVLPERASTLLTRLRERTPDTRHRVIKTTVEVEELEW